MDQFTISPSSGVPIYKQLYSQIERLIINGYFNQDDILPSVRQVAIDLEINPMTVSKAYGLLEERGYLIRLRGKGMAVAQRDNETSQKEKIIVINKMIEQLFAEAALMGVSQQKLQALIKSQMTAQSTSKANKE